MSVSVDVNWEGIEEAEHKLQQLDASIKSQVQQNLTNLAHSIENMARQLAPVKTGYLRSTIFAQIDDWTVKVGASAPYATYLEFGTHRTRAYGFLTKAVETHVPQLAKTLDDAIEAAVAEASEQ
jgi:HK97 gp10 family phage protein